MIEYPRAILRCLFLVSYPGLFLDPAQGDFEVHLRHF